jgi:NAD-dependent DNA ligase
MKITVSFINRLKKTPIDVLKELSEDEIASLIQHANHSYYNSDTPVFSDNLYDMIRDHLSSLNPQHPILKNVGSVTEGGKKQELPYFMGSLDKIKSDEKAVENFKREHPGTYIVSDKLDGNSAMIFYKEGEMLLFSRGNGEVGQNISHLIPFVQNIPCIRGKAEVTVRGELIISKADFEKVKHKGANPRNMVSGLVNAKVPDLEIVKLTQFVAYELIVPKLEPEKQMGYMREIGYKVVDSRVLKEKELTVTNLSDVLVKRRSDSEFDIDGIVVFHNAVHKRIKKNPTYAFAFKSILTMQQAEVIITSVEWNLSKDGYLIPVVNFHPIALAGVMIKRAHGFNGKFIKDNNIGPGSKIIIIRSGDVIPYIKEVITPSETGEPQMPDTNYVWTKTGVDITVDSSTETDELRMKKLVYFFDKIDVKGLSSGNVKKMYDAGLTTVKQIMFATKEDLLKVDGFKTKMAEKIVSALSERIADLDCIKVMDASNILGRGIGSKKIEMILTELPNILSNRHVPTMDELLTIKGIEKTTAKQFITNIPNYFSFVDENDLKCKFNGNDIVGQDHDVVISKMTAHMSGMKFVFTGFRNEKLEKYIKSQGGSVSTSVSKSTTAVVRKDSNDKDSSKVKKAEELNVPVIDLADFIVQHKIPSFT